MSESVGFPSVRLALQSLRASWIEWSERPFAQILLGTLLPAMVLVIALEFALTPPLKAFYLVASSIGCALSSIALARHRHSADVEAWLAGNRACLVALTLPWVLFIAAVSVTSFVALVRGTMIEGVLGPDWWMAFALLPAMLLVALPSLSTLAVFALWSRQAWRASRKAALVRRRAFAALGLVLPLALGTAAEFFARRAEQAVIARYVDSSSLGDPASLAAWRPISQFHGWRGLEARCAYGELTSDEVPTASQERARAALAALTGFHGYPSSGARD